MANKEFSKAIKRIRSNNKFTMQEKNAALKSIVDQITYDKKINHIDVDYYLIETPEAL